MVVAAACAYGLPAQADEPGGLRIGVDVEYVVPIDEEIEGGPGGGARVGYELDAMLLSLTPELGGSYHSLSGDLEPSVYRGVVGLRLSFLKVLEPGIYGHVGLAHTNFDLGRLERSWTDVTYDLGVTLDVTLLPLFEFGGHVGYAYMAPEESDLEGIDWVTLGVHGTLAF